MYYLISNYDGDFAIERYETKDQLLERVEENAAFETYVPVITDLTSEGECLIIKGEIVTPTPKKVVETFDVK